MNFLKVTIVIMDLNIVEPWLHRFLFLARNEICRNYTNIISRIQHINFCNGFLEMFPPSYTWNPLLLQYELTYNNNILCILLLRILWGLLVNDNILLGKNLRQHVEECEYLLRTYFNY